MDTRMGMGIIMGMGMMVRRVCMPRGLLLGRWLLRSGCIMLVRSPLFFLPPFFPSVTNTLFFFPV